MRNMAAAFDAGEDAGHNDIERPPAWLLDPSFFYSAPEKER